MPPTLETMSWFPRVEAWFRAHPGKVDWSTAAVLALFPLGVLLFAAVDVFTGGYTGLSDTWVALVHLLSNVGYVMAMGWRRTHPRRSLWITVGSGLIVTLLAADVNMLSWLTPVIIYSVVAYGNRADGRWAVIWSFIASFLASLTLNFNQGWPEDLGERWRAIILYAVFLEAICGVGIVSGYLFRARRLAQQALQDRAQRLEQEQEQERALAAADERRRIAREMHDVVAHSLSVVIAQADGARYAAAADPEIATETLGTIAQTSREALQEMRSLLGVLRTEADDAAPKAPAPDLGQVPTLVENVRNSGLPLEFTTVGEPRRSLPSGAELAAYRAVQEALTNVLKHAGPEATATLTFTWTPHGLSIDVTDTGRGPSGADGLGRGQQGMRERVGLYGGDVDFSRPGQGGYSVHAFLPYEEI